MSAMISFPTETGRFDLRAAAVVLDGSRVLLHQLGGDGFWSLPGGRVEAGEPAAIAVVREMKEELDEDVRCGDLLCVVENFFSHRDRAHHEVGLYFRVSLEAQSRLLTTLGPYQGVEGDRALTFEWFERSALNGLDVRPAFLAQALSGKDLTFTHVVQRDAR